MLWQAEILFQWLSATHTCLSKINPFGFLCNYAVGQGDPKGAWDIRSWWASLLLRVFLRLDFDVILGGKSGPHRSCGWCDTLCVSAEKGPGVHPLWVVYLPLRAEVSWLATAFLHYAKGWVRPWILETLIPPEPGSHPLHNPASPPMAISVPWLVALTLSPEHPANALFAAAYALPHTGVDGLPRVWMVRIGKATQWGPQKTTKVGGLVHENIWERCHDGCPGQSCTKDLEVHLCLCHYFPSSSQPPLVITLCWILVKSKKLVFLFFFLCRGFKSVKCWVLFRTHFASEWIRELQ